MTSKELLNIIRAEEIQEFSIMELYREIFGEDSTILATQKGRWQALYLLIKKLEKMEEPKMNDRLLIAKLTRRIL